MFQKRPLKLEWESIAALIGAVLTAILLLLSAIHAGPLWRDEVNTANMAQMPSLREMWRNQSCESFPPLWVVLLRVGNWLGMAGSDWSIRVLGLYVGLLFLGCLWLCARWTGGRGPTLSLGLLGCLPAFIFMVGSNRAYGLASCLLVLCFGTVWRMLERPSPGRILAAGAISFLFAHCVYYDAIFLAAILAGGAAVALLRREWKTIAALVGIGLVSAGSLAVYLPIIRQGASYGLMVRWPGFNLHFLWAALGDALTARASSESGPNGQEVWIWIVLLAGGLAAALIAQRRRGTPLTAGPAGPASLIQVRADLALYCAVSMVIGVTGQMAFWYWLHFFTQKWYFVEMLCLCGISLDGLFGANWPALRPWGLMRIALMAGLMAWGARAAWNEAHTRRSNIDMVAAVLARTASNDDLIVLQSAWDGITFNRYYHGPTRWVTVPPIDSHLVHRNDLILRQMKLPDAMFPVLSDITNTLQNGHSVWVLGGLSGGRATRPAAGQPAWMGAYILYWNSQISTTLMNHALTAQVLDVSGRERVCVLENLPVVYYSGFRPDLNGTNTPPGTTPVKPPGQ